MSVFNVSTKGSYIEGVVDIHMACSIDIARVKRHHITVIPSQGIGWRRNGLHRKCAIIFNCIILSHICISRHKHRGKRQPYSVVETGIVYIYLLYPYCDIKINRCRSNSKVGNCTEGM